MTDPVCAHGQTAAQGCVWCPKKPGGTEYETGYDRAPINREQIMLGDITDLRERVSDLERTIAEHRQNWLRNDIRNWKAIREIERQLANCDTPQEPPRGNVRMISVQAGSVYEDKIVCGCGRWHHFVVHAVLPNESSEPVQATALGDSPTQSDRFGCASGSEPFDLVTAIATVLKSRDTDWDYEVDEYMDDADAVLSVLRSTAFRQWAASKEDHSECDYYCSRGDCFVSLSSLLTELFGEVGRVTSLYFFTCQVCHEPYQIKDGITIEVDGGYGTKSPCCGDVAPHWYSDEYDWTPPEYNEPRTVIAKIYKFGEWIKDPDAYLEMEPEE